MSKWMPIETAPKDVEVLVRRKDGVMHIAKVSGYGDRRYGILSADFGDASCMFFFPVGGDYGSDDTPTHWMPLPSPPQLDSTPQSDNVTD